VTRAHKVLGNSWFGQKSRTGELHVRHRSLLGTTNSCGQFAIAARPCPAHTVSTCSMQGPSVGQHYFDALFVHMPSIRMSARLLDGGKVR